MSDSTGQPIWTSGLVAGTPSNLLGYPVYTTDAMPAFSAGNCCVAFGAWDQGYLLAERNTIRILLDPYSVAGYVKFYVARRVGGCVYNNDCVKVLKHAVS